MNEEQILKEWNEFQLKEYGKWKIDRKIAAQFWLSVLAVEIKKAEERGRNDAVEYILTGSIY